MGKPAPASEEDLGLMITLSMCGQTNTDIAKTFGVSKQTVSYHLRTAGFTANNRSSGKPYGESVEYLIARLERTGSWHEYRWHQCCPQSGHFKEEKPLAAEGRK